MGNIVPKDGVRREFEDLKSDLNQGKIPREAAENREMQNLPLNIAVVGKAGAGKSSFINAIRAMNDDDEEAAEVGRVEETKVPKAYPYPSFPNITIWELPEIRERNSKAAEYFKNVKFETYDVFIMIVTDRFTENDAFLAKEIQRMRKKFYYVRSKIDISIEGEKRKRNFNLDKTLETVRNYCEDNLKESAELSERVFLVSNLHAHLYEFPRLRETMAAELPDFKKHVLTLAGQVLSENKLMDKKIKMKSYIKYLALVSGLCGIVLLVVYGAFTVVGFSLVCDIGILIFLLKRFRIVFGLDQSSLRFLALQTGKSFEELKSGIQERPLIKTVKAQLAIFLLMKSAFWCLLPPVKYMGACLCATVSVGKLVLDYISCIEDVFDILSSCVFMYYFLNKFPDNLVEDAQNVREKLLK